MLQLASSRDNPEVSLYKRRYRKVFAEVFTQSLKTLSPQERNVLRMRFIDDLSAEAIASFYRVHRTTVMRWLEKSQATLLEMTRSGLRERLNLRNSELDSLLGLVQSGMHESLVAYLKPSRE
jgi:RNA polymerase sigma-70 factor (ECF subfamily)